MTTRSRRWESAPSFDEAWRVLSANLREPLAALGRRSVMVTSARADEGKTTTCARLGAALARRGLRVVVVDASVRDPALHDQLGVANDLGLADIIDGQARLGSCLQRVGLSGGGAGMDRGLFVLPAGRPVEDPDEVLSRPRTERILDRLADESDVVLVDAPPVLPVADALTVGRAVGAALLVVDPRRTGAGPLQRARDLLARNHTDILGLVVNQVRGADGPAFEDYEVSRPGGEATGGAGRRTAS